MHTVILHNIRSTHNVGSILRTCDGFGIERVYIGGYTPYPRGSEDKRLPHIADKITKQIAKTALGAENTVQIILYEDIYELLEELRQDDYSIVALEQNERSIALEQLPSKQSVALLLGSEVEGIETDLLTRADIIAEIPMYGAKESFNVAVASGIALYVISHKRYTGS